jgi:hypothetical protein
MSLQKLAKAIEDRSHFDKHKYKYLAGLSAAGVVGGTAAYGIAGINESGQQYKRNLASAGIGLGAGALSVAPVAMLENSSGRLGDTARFLKNRVGAKGAWGVAGLGALAAIQQFNKSHNAKDPLFRRPEGFFDPITKHPIFN